MKVTIEMYEEPVKAAAVSETIIDTNRAQKQPGIENVLDVFEMVTMHLLFLLSLFVAPCF